MPSERVTPRQPRRPSQPRPPAQRRAAGEQQRARPLAGEHLHTHEKVRVNPIACEAHGMCAELLPERIVLDEWGYPIVDDRPLSSDIADHARRAAQACPTFALLIERRQPRG